MRCNSRCWEVGHGGHAHTPLRRPPAQAQAFEADQALAAALAGFEPRAPDSTSPTTYVRHVVDDEPSSGTGTRPSSPPAQFAREHELERAALLEQIGFLLTSVDELQTALRDERAYSSRLETELAELRAVTAALRRNGTQQLL